MRKRSPVAVASARSEAARSAARRCLGARSRICRSCSAVRAARQMPSSYQDFEDEKSMAPHPRRRGEATSISAPPATTPMLVSPPASAQSRRHFHQACHLLLTASSSAGLAESWHGTFLTSCWPSRECPSGDSFRALHAARRRAQRANGHHLHTVRSMHWFGTPRKPDRLVACESTTTPCHHHQQRNCPGKRIVIATRTAPRPLTIYHNSNRVI